MTTKEFSDDIKPPCLALWLATRAGYTKGVWEKAIHFNRVIMAEREEELINALEEHRNDMTRLLRKMRRGVNMG